jgi:hypothetical protein
MDSKITPENAHTQCGLPGSPYQMFGTGDLALFLGGSPDSFTGVLLNLIVKADPGNRARLADAFPAVVHAWRIWGGTDPAPTADELRAILVRHQPDQVCDCIVRGRFTRVFHCAAAYR